MVYISVHLLQMKEMEDDVLEIEINIFVCGPCFFVYIIYFGLYLAYYYYSFFFFGENFKFY